MFKNVASQKLAVFAYDNASGEPKTGDAANISAQISKDGGACSATDDVNPTELDAVDAKGVYIFDLTQAETNADMIVLSAVSSTADITLEPVMLYTAPVVDTGAVKLAADGLDNVVVDEPSGDPDGWSFAQKLVWLCMRFLNKHTSDNFNGIKVFKADGSVSTTQTVTDANGVKTVGKSS